MTVAVAPTRPASVDQALQQVLMRFAGALSRRRTYAATHPMVVSAEAQLHESAVSFLVSHPVLTIGVAATELIIDGEPFVTRSAYARELASSLHRRGVGAITLQVGVPQAQLRETLAWLATEPATDAEFADDRPPVLSSIGIARVAYDKLTLADVVSAAQASCDRLWYSLAQIASGESVDGESAANARETTNARDTENASPDGSRTTIERDAVLSALRSWGGRTDVARRTAIAIMDLAAHGVAAPPEGRSRIGEQLYHALTALGLSSFGPVIRSLGDRTTQHRFISQMVDVLPVAAVAQWLQVAAQAQDQQLSHHMLRLMSKLSGFAEATTSARADTAFRRAAQDLVKGWALEDSNPEEHVALLDRIAMHERSKRSGKRAASIASPESSRLVQMALEIDAPGDDATAAASALVDAGMGLTLLGWAGTTTRARSAAWLTEIATGGAAIRRLLLTEPVDRLEARSLLERLDIGATDTLIDVLEAAEARGTRMIVRQRLSEFGDAIAPNLLARLDTAPWYLVRNILTLLHEISVAHSGATAGMESLACLLDHAQVQVRTETFRLLMLDPSARESTIRHALRDENERVVVLALQAIADPSDGTPTLNATLAAELMAMVEAGTQNDTVRARMVRTMAEVKSDAVRDWLIGLVVRRSPILRRLSLNEPTLIAVAAMQVLQRVYANDVHVEPLLALARKHGYDRRWLSRDGGSAPEQAT